MLIEGYAVNAAKHGLPFLSGSFLHALDRSCLFLGQFGLGGDAGRAEKPATLRQAKGRLFHVKQKVPGCYGKRTNSQRILTRGEGAFA